MTKFSHHIDYSIYRVLLSEVLPYELPFFFSFKDFYYFADRARLAISDDGSISKKSHKMPHEVWSNVMVGMLNECKQRHKSFTYGINKDGKSKGRKLVLVHPYVALEIVKFYKEYAGFILNSCCRSNYSLRHPTKIAYNRKKVQGETSLKDITEEETVKLPRNYFLYEPIKNINIFYEGSLLERLESKFSHMYITDMKHCFDNIPTNRMAEAAYLTDKVNLSFGTFAANAQRIMKDMTNGEDNVAIGPEFSRVFAEIILQKIDIEIESEMEAKDLVQQKDYACFRYVDDCFFFYNDENVKKQFVNIQDNVLKSWELSLNKDKSKDYSLPYITPITKAKDQVIAMLDGVFEFRLETAKGLVHINEGIYDNPLQMSSHNCIKTIKSIIAAKDVDISKITSFLLYQLQKRLVSTLDRLDTLLREYQEAEKDMLLDMEGKKILRRYERSTVSFLCQLAQFIFFVFRADTRMSTSIRVVSILDIIIRYTENKLFKDSDAAFFNSNRNVLYKTIHDELVLILRNKKLDCYCGLEICNVLSIMNVCQTISLSVVI